MTSKELALEELKILREIAQNQEELRFKIRGWCTALITALSVAFLSKEIKFSGGQFFLISSVVLFLFLWLDVLYRVAQDRAYTRSNIVESFLRGEEEKYEGPKIGSSLSMPNNRVDQLKSLNNIRVYSPYIPLLVLVIIIGVW